MLTTVNCAPTQEPLRKTLIRLYDRLGEIVEGHECFGGFVDTEDLGHKYRMSVEKYPRLTMRFSNEDLKAMARYAGMSAQELMACAMTPLEYLAIAALWKQADLQKVRHIAAGIVETVNETRCGLIEAGAPVFKQFGRHLSDPARQPIADQHTLRAYRYQLGQDLSDSRHRLGTVKAQEVEDYVKFVRNLAGSEISADRLYEFDQSMFALGKATGAFIKAELAQCQTSTEKNIQN